MGFWSGMGQRPVDRNGVSTFLLYPLTWKMILPVALFHHSRGTELLEWYGAETGGQEWGLNIPVVSFDVENDSSCCTVPSFEGYRAFGMVWGRDGWREPSRLRLWFRFVISANS